MKLAQGMQKWPQFLGNVIPSYSESNSVAQYMVAVDTAYSSFLVNLLDTHIPVSQEGGSGCSRLLAEP